MKKILIVGATSAIACACARLWAADRSELFLVGRDAQKLQQTSVDLQARGARAVTTYVMDASDIAAHPVMYEKCLATLQTVDICLIAYGSLPDQYACEQHVEEAAVSTFCEGLRVRLFKAGVHVITIKPGLVDTPMTQGLALPSLLVAQPDTVARRIVRGINRQVAVLYVPGFWGLIMWLIRVMPQPLFKRLNL